MSTENSQPKSSQELGDQAKRDHWVYLLDLESKNQLPPGESVISLHDAFCAEIDAETAASNRRIAEMNKQKEQAVAALRDTAIDLHVSDRAQQTDRET